MHIFNSGGCGKQISKFKGSQGYTKTPCLEKPKRRRRRRGGIGGGRRKGGKGREGRGRVL